MGAPPEKSTRDQDEVEQQTIQIALQGAMALLQKITNVKRQLIPSLKKMIAAAKDALQILSA